MDIENLLEKIKALEKDNELLKSENKKLFSAVNNSPATIVITDVNGVIEFANPGFTEITGYTNEEAIGLKPSVLKSGYHNELFYKKLWDTIRSGNVWQGDFYNRKKDGTFYWEQAHIAPIKDEQGNVSNFVAIKFDITKKVESENYLKTITSTIPELIFVMDEDGRYIDIKFADEDTLEYIKEKYIGKLVNDVFPITLASKLKNFIQTTIETGIKQTLEYEIENLSGTIWFEATSALFPIKLSGKKCVVIAAHDITYRKKAEHDLKELNATKDKFFTILAHDLRNPFGALLSFSKILLEDLERNDISDSIRLAKYINTSAELIFDLLENLLQWARSQTGRLEYKPQKIILSDLVNNVVQLHQSQACNKQITLTSKLQESLVVKADMNLLNTVMRNLISNAIKYTPPDGNVWVEVSKIPGFVQVTVVDTGVGIPPQGIAKLFRIDTMYSTVGTGSEKGTGLGLILCKEFIELQGGTIRVESELGKGTKFIFTIPD